MKREKDVACACHRRGRGRPEDGFISMYNHLLKWFLSSSADRVKRKKKLLKSRHNSVTVLIDRYYFTHCRRCIQSVDLDTLSWFYISALRLKDY